MSKILCCENCDKERHIGCHATCKRYKLQKIALDVYNKQERKEKERYSDTLIRLNEMTSLPRKYKNYSLTKKIS